MMDEPPFGRQLIGETYPTVSSLEERVRSVAGSVAAPVRAARDTVVAFGGAYYASPRVSLHTNSVITAVGAMCGAAAVGHACNDYYASEQIVALSLVAKEAIAWGLPTILHLHANSHALREETSLNLRKATKSVWDYHVSSLVPGAIFTAIGAAGQWLLQREGMDAGAAALISYGAAIIPSRLMHERIAMRTGLYDRLARPTVDA